MAKLDGTHVPGDYCAALRPSHFPSAMHRLPRSQRRLAVYLINMDRATQRLAAMQSNLAAAGLHAERVPAVDGSTLSFPIAEFSERSYRLLHGRRTSPAEVGCYLSHVNCVRRFLDSDADLALILEDDVSFHDGFLDSLDRAATLTDEWDLLRLTTVNSGRKFAVRDLGNQHALAICLSREKGAGAYVINRRAAQWICTQLMPMRLAYDIAFDLEYLAGLKAAFVEPLIASQASEHETQIQHTIRQVKLPAWRYFTVMPYRTYLELRRVWARSLRLLSARWRWRLGSGSVARLWAGLTLVAIDAVNGPWLALGL
jgi:glycosyl transferase, family 25